ncbi:hypothetical protein [Nocardioides sp. MH1]|uniref:TetR/AcrR family transcriptional regulator n=1 Tax=Nocardioides sp. MH1 TaxID=3242490 RepID=UPI003520DB6E
MRSLDPTEDVALQLVRRFLVLCEHPRTRARMLRLVARSSRPDDAPRVLRWLKRALLMPQMRRGTRPVSAMKWELVASQLFGMATMRYLHELEPIASADRDTVVAMMAPGVLAVLRGPDEVFTALVVDDDEDLSDLGELADLEDAVRPEPARDRAMPAGGAALRRVQHGRS